VILLDNAPYHTSEGTVNLLGDLNIPVIYTGPYSYDAAPIELLFAALKMDDINPHHFKMAKG
jgi:transposase